MEADFYAWMELTYPYFRFTAEQYALIEQHFHSKHALTVDPEWKGGQEVMKLIKEYNESEDINDS